MLDIYQSVVVMDKGLSGRSQWLGKLVWVRRLSDNTVPNHWGLYGSRPALWTEPRNKLESSVVGANLVLQAPTIWWSLHISHTPHPVLPLPAQFTVLWKKSHTGGGKEKVEGNLKAKEGSAESCEVLYSWMLHPQWTGSYLKNLSQCILTPSPLKALLISCR